MKSTADFFSLKRNPTPYIKSKILKSDDAFKFVLQFYGDDIEIYESVFILLLDTAANTIGYAKIGQGTTTACLVDVKLIAMYAIKSLAYSVILVHNHPSGQLSASQADINLTRNVKEALRIFDIKLAEHLIITSKGYYSFADDGHI